MQVYEQSAPFRIEEDHQNKCKTKPPQCILDLHANSDRVPLTNAQLADAKEHCLHTDYLKLTFPRTRKFRVDPTINGQIYTLVTFIPSPNAIPDDHGCYGVFKVRGNFTTQLEAEQYAQFLLRNHDTLSDYDVTYVGRDFPLMKDNTCYTKETTEVNLQATVDDITKAHMKTKRLEERKEKEEVEKRHHKMISKRSSDEKDDDDTSDPLEVYTKLRTKRAYAQLRIDECMKHHREATEALERVTKEIEEMDQEHPDFRSQFLSKYERGLDSVGADKAQNSYIKYMKDDVDRLTTENQTIKLENMDEPVQPQPQVDKVEEKGAPDAMPLDVDSMISKCVDNIKHAIN